MSVRIPCSSRGASRSSRFVGAGCGGRELRARRTRCCGRRSRVVLIPRRWDQVCKDDLRATVASKPGTPGRARRKPLKPFACGNAGCFRWACSDYARVLFPFCTRGCGCIARPAFPTPSKGAKRLTARVRRRRENAESRHCEERSDEAIQTASEERVWIASLRSQ